MDFDKSQNLIATDHNDRLKTMFSNFSPARFSCLIALLAVSLLIAAKSETTEDRILYTDGFLQVVSPDGASVEQGREAAKKVMAAWKFDLNLMHWTHPAEMERPFTLRLISDDHMKREFPGARAYAKGNRFNVKMGLIGDPSIDRTFAHELGHLQAFRALGKYSVPRYFLEGHGLMLNQLYSDHLRLDRHVAGAGQVRGIMSITAEEAAAILTDDRYFKVGTTEEKVKKSNKMELMGLFFVEYLRVRKGIPDAIPKMGRVFESVGRGKTYEKAFAQTYGSSLNRTISEVVAYFKRTEAHPAERIKGTRLEEYLPAASR